jgi:hypothetical protein
VLNHTAQNLRNDLNDQVKAYQELQRTLMETDSLSSRDATDLSGPKFKFVLTEITEMFSTRSMARV